MARIEFNRIKINLITLLIYINNVYKVESASASTSISALHVLRQSSVYTYTLYAVNVKWNTKNHTSSDVQINTI